MIKEKAANVLSTKPVIEELIDRRGIRRDELERSLLDLEFTNRWMGGRSSLAPHILPHLSDVGSVLDVGSGSGDMLRWVADEAGLSGYSLQLMGLDVHPEVLEIARRRCGKYPEISFVQGSAVALPFNDGAFDMVISSTFLHHLEPLEAVKALSEAARVARKWVVVSDLVRSRWAAAGTWVLGRFIFGRLSQYDGPASFLRAYSPTEMRQFAEKAGIGEFRLSAGPVHMALICKMRSEPTRQ